MSATPPAPAGPFVGAARTVDAGGVRWYVATLGAGPALLLLHGTGASSHSFAALAPLLAERFTVVVPDLPGHARTGGGRADLSVDGMARATAALVAALDVRPVVAVGHSAGAAIVVRMTLDGTLAPRLVVGLNAALVPLDGPLRVFSPLAKLLGLAPGVPQLFSRFASDDRSVQRLVDSTGSRLDADGMRQYAALIRDPRHVAGALGMMASWNLERTWDEMRGLAPAPLLIVGDHDRTIPPAQARRVAAHVPGTKVVVLPGLGHLAHEEAPDAVAALIAERAAALGL